MTLEKFDNKNDKNNADTNNIVELQGQTSKTIEKLRNRSKKSGFNGGDYN